MATTIQSSQSLDDDYIDMEIISSSSPPNIIFPYSSIDPPPHNSSTTGTTKEFEFQMSLAPNQEKDQTLTFPADELFYKGKLLPLHLPPRLQMVQTILQDTSTSTSCSTSLKTKLEDQEEEEEEFEEETFTIPFNMINRRSVSTAPCTNTTNTPLESCNISPSESCRVSCELNPDEYISQWSNEVRVFLGENRTSTSKKHSSSIWSTTKFMKQFSLGKKLKASRAYLKSLFNHKSSCNVSEEEVINVSSSKKNTSFGRNENQISTTLMKRIETEIMAEAADKAALHHRKSFSGVFQRHVSSTSSYTSTTSSGSSSSSSSFSLSSSNGCCYYDNLQLLKRSSSANSELESSIEGAIAHCKQSCFNSSGRSTNYKDGAFSLSNSASSRIAV